MLYPVYQKVLRQRSGKAPKYVYNTACLQAYNYQINTGNVAHGNYLVLQVCFDSRSTTENFFYQSSKLE